jgi:Mn2+/Fe2+ NRAMP family transporter
VVTNIVTLVSEFVAIRVGMAYFHLGVGASVASGLVLVVLSLTGGRYWRWERIALGLALFNVLFLVAAILVKPDLASVGKAFVTFSPFPHGSFNTILLLIASTVGATVTPWMLFFQQRAVADKGVTARDIRQGRFDTVIGGVLAAITGCGALVAAAVLATRNGPTIDGLTGAGFPAALGRVAGSPTVFALGLIEAGALAILTISASTAYAVSECVGMAHSFNRSLREALLFYACSIGAALIAAGVILIPGAPLLSIALNANVLAYLDSASGRVDLS